jgi:hypothetical protein
MARDRRELDPYAPPPRHRDSSGLLVRGVILAALIGAAALGYTYYASQPQQEAALEQEVAENQAPLPAPAPPPAAEPAVDGSEAQPRPEAPIDAPQTPPG